MHHKYWKLHQSRVNILKVETEIRLPTYEAVSAAVLREVKVLVEFKIWGTIRHKILEVSQKEIGINKCKEKQYLEDWEDTRIDDLFLVYNFRVNSWGIKFKSIINWVTNQRIKFLHIQYDFDPRNTYIYFPLLQS